MEPKYESGLQRVNLTRHIAGIADLIQLAFGNNLDAEAQRAVKEMHILSRTGPLLWLLRSISDSSSNWQQGFVFLRDEHIIGSVGAQLSDCGPHAWLIANLAVHPEFRRKGIGRQLMQAALERACRQGAHYVVLQVNDDNTEAIPLYENLGFVTVTIRTTWERRQSNAPRLIKTGHDLQLRQATSSDWREELALLEEFRPVGLNWTSPFRVDHIKPSPWRTVGNLINARREERWIAICDGKVVGWFHLLSQAGASHQLQMIVRTEWRPELEKIILVRSLHRLRHLPWPIRLEHPSDEAQELLHEQGFRVVRTLRWMKKHLR